MVKRTILLLATISTVVIMFSVGLPTSPGWVQAEPPEPVLGELDLDAVAALDLTAYPLVPTISEYARQVYLDGLEQGNNTHAFAKVGDCMTHNPYFLIPIGKENYELGEYTSLQPTIEHFMAHDPNPFARESQAAAGGFNSASILDSLWANPKHCEAGESPLECEFRVMQPSIALIMFGTNDVYYLPEDQFDYFMRSIVVETLNNATLPVLSTFPIRPEFPEKSVLYNQIVAQIATDYDVPLINLWLALEPLPNQGVDPVDTTYMTTPETSGAVCHFIGPNLEAGFTMRNLLTLRTLDEILNIASANADAD